MSSSEQLSGTLTGSAAHLGVTCTAGARLAATLSWKPVAFFGRSSGKLQLELGKPLWRSGVH